MLQLRKFDTREQTVPSVNIQVTGIWGQLQRLSQSIINDFGNSGRDYSVDPDDVGGSKEESQMAHGASVVATELCITTEEFPWVTTPLGTMTSPSGDNVT